jgi:ABC-2 type transport system permease protein
VLRGVQAQLPKRSPLRADIDPVIRFSTLARQNLGLAGPLLQSIGTPIRVQTKIVKGGSTPLGAFAAAIAVAVTLMLVTVLLAAGSLALEREENAFRRLVRGLVSHTGLLVEKVSLAAVCSLVVGLVLLAGLSISVTLPWGRFGLWVLALAFGAVAFGALGVAMGALAREVRASSLLAFMASLPIAVLGLIPSGAVSSSLYDVVRAVSAIFPFKPTLDALRAALSHSGGIGGPLLHLALLTAAFTLLARLALRRFA